MFRSRLALGRSVFVIRKNVWAVNPIRLNSTGTSSSSSSSSSTPEPRKLTAAQQRKQRDQLAKSSIKDVFELFMPGHADETDTIEIDPTPIYANPKLYLNLTTPQQHYILEELNNKYLRKSWKKMPQDVKRFHYFLAYGNYGPRESFPETNSDQLQFDIPFKIPSFITTQNPSPTTIIKRLPYNINYKKCGPVRLKQFEKDSRMDIVSKIILFITALLTVLNFKRDRKIVNTNKVPTNEYEKYMERIQEQERIIFENEKNRKLNELKNQNVITNETTNGRKWYYLWIK
ncbi:hypothetical protein PACTADRAFT_82818 [Pachysolen tannophilus NRRL Y-2460]|uniref:Genetic interactor of prohibitin 7, mitochondrial n=1 Tax=Pachysolen tannophilus NRRL Y-2460 TaxID=669874 RepID=A0A1E4TP53_PACTA|nr:hypothetical protein PACTADRAFT_82818 [Pachysolen tannophilus NRRL Y-2460]